MYLGFPPPKKKVFLKTGEIGLDSGVNSVASMSCVSHMGVGQAWDKLRRICFSLDVTYSNKGLSGSQQNPGFAGRIGLADSVDSPTDSKLLTRAAFGTTITTNL